MIRDDEHQLPRQSSEGWVPEADLPHDGTLCFLADGDLPISFYPFMARWRDGAWRLLNPLEGRTTCSPRWGKPMP